MRFKSSVILTVLVTLILSFSSCVGEETPELKTFYGDCIVEVSVKQSDAVIYLDGIKVAYNSRTRENIPCGYKEVIVKKAGYTPYKKYFKVTETTPLNLAVELTEMDEVKNYALSDEIINQLKSGTHPYNPWDEKAVKLAEYRVKNKIKSPLFSEDASKEEFIQELPEESASEENVDLDDYKNWL